jgi:hypothetical protein
MKYIIIISISFLFLTVHSQNKYNLIQYSKDTLLLLDNLTFLGDDKMKFKSELLNIYHSEVLSRYKIKDTVYIYSLKNLPYKEEFLTDGNHINTYLFDTTINKISTCNWIELNEIKLFKHHILLTLIFHKRINFKDSETIIYKFKIIGRRNSSEEINGFYAPRYRLIKKEKYKP